ncbi:unnamed protein product [Urochloa humidicola]
MAAARRVGMLVIYASPLAAALTFFVMSGAVEDLRAQVLTAVVTVHFLQCVLKVLFVHRYSGSMPLATALLISSCYLFNAAAMIYVQHLNFNLQEPAIDLLCPGMLVFTTGLAGSFYHHLRSRIRAGADGGGGGDKGYKIPQGGLFGLVACPHYLFEIIEFFELAMVS